MSGPGGPFLAREPVRVVLAAMAAVLLSVACGGGGNGAGRGPDPGASPALTPSAPPSGVAVSATGTSAAATTVPTLAAASATSPGPVATAKPADSPAVTAVVTATATTQGAPQRAFGAGEWTYDYRLVGNTCGADAAKTYLPVTQVLEEVSPNDGYIADGEQVRVYGFNGGPSLGTIAFRWPTLSYQVPLNEPGGIRTEVTHTYFDARSGTSKVVEVYVRGAGTCELTYAG